MTDTNNYELDPDPETAAQLIKPKLSEISERQNNSLFIYSNLFNRLLDEMYLKGWEELYLSKTSY